MTIAIWSTPPLLLAIAAMLAMAILAVPAVFYLVERWSAAAHERFRAPATQPGTQGEQNA